MTKLELKERKKNLKFGKYLDKVYVELFGDDTQEDNYGVY